MADTPVCCGKDMILIDIEDKGKTHVLTYKCDNCNEEKVVIEQY
jgi:hypothetical protein